jgi:hypothetical protein
MRISHILATKARKGYARPEGDAAYGWWMGSDCLVSGAREGTKQWGVVIRATPPCLSYKRRLSFVVNSWPLSYRGEVVHITTRNGRTERDAAKHGTDADMVYELPRRETQ